MFYNLLNKKYNRILFKYYRLIYFYSRYIKQALSVWAKITDIFS